MASVNDAPYLKAASFHSLSSTTDTLLDTYAPSTVMMVVTQELPINTSIALTEASPIGASIKDAMFRVENMEPKAFINKKWK